MAAVASCGLSTWVRSSGSVSTIPSRARLRAMDPRHSLATELLYMEIPCTSFSVANLTDVSIRKFGCTSRQRIGGVEYPKAGLCLPICVIVPSKLLVRICL